MLSQLQMMGKLRRLLRLCCLHLANAIEQLARHYIMHKPGKLRTDLLYECPLFVSLTKAVEGVSSWISNDAKRQSTGPPVG